MPNVDAALQQRCSTSSKAPLLLSAGVILLDGSKKSCAWGNDRDAVAKGILGPKALPRATRRDYVENSNDSYWLPSARFRLTGFPRIIGPEGTQRLLRTRLGLVQAEQRLAGTDGLGPAGFTLDTMKAVFNANRNLSAELAKDAVVQAAARAAAPTCAEACAVLAAWDGRADIGSRGAVLWRETWSRLVDAPASRGRCRSTRPTRSTPRAISTGPTRRSPRRCAARSQDLRAKGIPLDVPLGDKQAEPRGSERIGIPGCSEGEGCFNIISTRRDEQGNYDPFTGSSFVMAAGFDAQGPPERLGDPLLLAVREPALAALRRPDAAVLAGAVAADALHRARRSRPTRTTRGGW